MARKKPQVFGTRGIFVANCNENQIKMLSFVMFYLLFKLTLFSVPGTALAYAFHLATRFRTAARVFYTRVWYVLLACLIFSIPPEIRSLARAFTFRVTGALIHTTRYFTRNKSAFSIITKALFLTG